MLGYRVFSDAAGKMNLPVQNIDGAGRAGGVLLVSQFTLAADTRQRPASELHAGRAAGRRQAPVRLLRGGGAREASDRRDGRIRRGHAGVARQRRAGHVLAADERLSLRAGPRPIRFAQSAIAMRQLASHDHADSVHPARRDRLEPHQAHSGAHRHSARRRPGFAQAQQPRAPHRRRGEARRAARRDLFERSATRAADGAARSPMRSACRCSCAKACASDPTARSRATTATRSTTGFPTNTSHWQTRDPGFAPPGRRVAARVLPSRGACDRTARRRASGRAHRVCRAWRRARLRATVSRCVCRSQEPRD